MKYRIIKDEQCVVPFEKDVVVYRIECVTAFGDVESGQKGGFVQSEHNLSQTGDAWIDEESYVYDDAIVRDNATIKGGSYVHGSAIVCDNAVVAENSQVFGEATVSGNAVVEENSYVSDNAVVTDDAYVHRHSSIRGNSVVCDETEVSGGAVVTDCVIAEYACISGIIELNGEIIRGSEFIEGQ